MILISSALLFIDDGFLSFVTLFGPESRGQGLGGWWFDGRYRSGPYSGRSAHLGSRCDSLAIPIALIQTSHYHALSHSFCTSFARLLH